jgi:hypothetical protein
VIIGKRKRKRQKKHSMKLPKKSILLEKASSKKRMKIT